jgi:GLPGLI family protein
MIKIITKLTVVAIVFATSILKAQNFQGQAFYESKTNVEGTMKLESPSMTEEMKKQLLESMKKAFEKSYVLTFNKTESIYEEEQKLDAPSPGIGGGMMIKMENSTDGKLYKNIKDKVLITEGDFFGKEFLITDSLATCKWNLESESKKIGDYTCYKAKCIIPVSEKDKQDFADFKNKQSDTTTQFMIMDEPKDEIITVWYTPEIPISQGPDKYWGLPGLILEANFDKTVVLCSKIILNPKEKISIKKPKKGRKVTKEEYERLIENQLEQMKDDKGDIKIEIH